MLNSHSIARPFGTLHVADLARRAQVTPATIRYYARIGLLDPGREPENDYRCFSTADLHRVMFIRQAQGLGLTIGDIKSILETLDNGDIPCHQVRALVEQRLASIRDRIADLKATEARITHAMKSWEQMDYPTPLDGELCPLIERLDTETGAVAKLSPQPTGQRRQNHTGHQHRRDDAAQSAFA